MELIRLNQLDIHDVGSKIQLYGALYSDGATMYILPLPDEGPTDIQLPKKVLIMTGEDWQVFLNQSDVLDVKNAAKAILRKSQRNIDQFIAWEVYARDGYACRYCGRKLPLTIDHIILWEDGGPTVADNLLSACRRCNKLRGNLSYKEWIISPDYENVSRKLTADQMVKNMDLVFELTRLDSLPKAKPRSR